MWGQPTEGLRGEGGTLLIQVTGEVARAKEKGAGHRHLGGGATGVAWQGNDLPVLPPSPSFVPFANL